VEILAERNIQASGQASFQDVVYYNAKVEALKNEIEYNIFVEKKICRTRGHRGVCIQAASILKP